MLDNKKIIEIAFKNNDDIKSGIYNNTSAQQLAHDIIDRALKDGTGDNVSCIVINLWVKVLFNIYSVDCIHIISRFIINA